jgi:Fe-Mn family superoxide dismutase
MNVKNENKSESQREILIEEMKKIGIEKLPYSYSALKPFIDAETMDFHYNKHYKGYVDKLNQALSKKKMGDWDLEKIIKNISRYDKTVRNNAGGAFNHALFWNMLTPTPVRLKGELQKKIFSEFKTFTNFKKKFELIAKERFGSGWVWLVLTKNNKLKIMSTPNQDNPLMNIIEGGGFPLLGLDLWEHAYYLKYKNKRDEYISNFWKVVNWDFVSKLFELKTQTKLLENKISKQIMTEGKSYIVDCSTEDEKFFQNLMKDNEISKLYGMGIYAALKQVDWLEFKPKDPEKNIMQGFYKNGERHNISYLAGNYRAFCLITKSVNRLLKDNNRDILHFQNRTPKEQVLAVKKLTSILKKYSSKIFVEDSPFFQKIMSNLSNSKTKGDKVENQTKKRLENEFGLENVDIQSEFGSESDNQGTDGQIFKNEKINTFQIKPLTNYKIVDDLVYVETTGKILPYEQDWMIFTNKFETIILENNATTFGSNAYIFPVSSLIYTLV